MSKSLRRFKILLPRRFNDLIRLFVDVADSPEHWQFFQQHKEHLKARYQQVEIWLTTFLVEAL